MQENALRGRLASGFDRIAEGEICFFLPAMSGLAPKVVDILACLPIANVNGKLMASLSRRESARLVDFACIFAADPFYDPERLSDDVLSFGVKGVINLPSIGFLTGPFSEAMNASGFDFRREMHCLRAAKRRGLRTAALVWSLEQGSYALEHGPDVLVIHPRRPAGQEDSSRVLAEEATNTVSGLRERAKNGCQILLYRHPAIFENLESAAKLADGILVYGS
jgi:predicted TIM-barrel enzyme